MDKADKNILFKHFTKARHSLELGNGTENEKCKLFTWLAEMPLLNHLVGILSCVIDLMHHVCCDILHFFKSMCVK